MTTYRNTTSDWFGHTAVPDWIKRIGNSVRAFFEAIDTGLRASHDYERLAAHIPPEDAIRIVFQKHFSK